MPGRLITLPMPQGGAERGVEYSVHHHCPQGNALRKSQGEDVDLVTWWPGLHGGLMPAWTTFPVPSVEPCGACGVVLQAWFQWSAPKVWVP